MAVIRGPVSNYNQCPIDLAKLEPGDKVATVQSGYYGTSITVYVVTKLTATQVVCESTAYGRAVPQRWRIKDGLRVGCKGFAETLLPLDDDQVINARQAAVMAELKVKVADVLSARFNGHDERQTAVAAVMDMANQAREKLGELESRRVKP